jgi:hypothetical protein
VTHQADKFDNAVCIAVIKRKDDMVVPAMECCTSTDIYNAMVLCAENGCVIALRYMIGNGADPTATDESGTTLLHAACKAGSVYIVRDLLYVDGVPQTYDNDGVAPVILATAHPYRESSQLIALLISASPIPARSCVLFTSALLGHRYEISPMRNLYHLLFPCDVCHTPADPSAAMSFADRHVLPAVPQLLYRGYGRFCAAGSKYERFFSVAARPWTISTHRDFSGTFRRHVRHIMTAAYAMCQFQGDMFVPFEMWLLITGYVARTDVPIDNSHFGLDTLWRVFTLFSMSAN